jgi:hypothetical protein
MNRRSAITAVSALLCSAFFLSGTAFAQQGKFGTPAEARAMFDKAIAAIKADKAKALDMFNKGEGGFRDRDLYVFCFDDKTGIFNAHVVKTLLGTDISPSRYPITTPIRRIRSGLCARAASGQPTAAPLRSVVNSRRFIR